MPEGLPPEWVTALPEPHPDRPPLELAELAGLDAVLTTVTVAIAQTGTLVLDHGPGQGRRALTLVPDVHVAVVARRRIVAAVPDAVAVLDPGSALTWISGPSATSDIELNRVQGVHGPRTLIVLILTETDPEFTWRCSQQVAGHRMVRPGSRPKARSRRYRVERDIPRAAAAWIRLPPHSRNASTMASRSSASRRVSDRRPCALT